MQGILRIFKIDEPKKGISTKTGKPYEIHTAQCALLTDAGELDQVGVLDLPPTFRGKVTQGDYRGTYAMGVNFQNGKIGPVLTDLQPLTPRQPSAPAPSAPVKQ
ncbi:hypothetical protein J2W23_000232 [Variovorax boronicumulans]|uniref:hypothetical protein n=1 Tax=Variovorax boronicumulans TaxID=436515 RepID=UPI00277EE734|nr:hypothetical protein [Variovorax boronicumulans]MDQ0011868.1 hypothetical protein [Variovorax boronicumulans]